MANPSGINSDGHSEKSSTLSLLEWKENHGTTDQTVPSGSTADLLGSSISITVPVGGAAVEVFYSFSTRTNNILGLATTNIQLLDNGTLVEGVTQGYSAVTGATQGASFSRGFPATGPGSLSAGVHVFKLSMTAIGGQTRIFSATNLSAEHVSGIVKVLW
jgi:hypothetical protein